MIGRSSSESAARRDDRFNGAGAGRSPRLGAVFLSVASCRFPSLPRAINFLFRFSPAFAPLLLSPPSPPQARAFFAPQFFAIWADGAFFTGTEPNKYSNPGSASAAPCRGKPAGWIDPMGFAARRRKPPHAPTRCVPFSLQPNRSGSLRRVCMSRAKKKSQAEACDRWARAYFLSKLAPMFCMLFMASVMTFAHDACSWNMAVAVFMHAELIFIMAAQ